MISESAIQDIAAKFTTERGITITQGAKVHGQGLARSRVKS